MRLRGTVSQDAQDRLHKNFLPALEKMAATAQLLVRKDTVVFLQMEDDGTEGAFVKLELPTDYIFSALALASQKDDAIAFSVNIGLLSKVFDVASSMEADTMQVHLATVEARGTDGSKIYNADGSVQKQPCLRFMCKGLVHTSTLEVEISKPYSASQIDELHAMSESMQLMDWYLNVAAHVGKMEAVLHTVGRTSQWVTVLTSRAGELHLQVCTETAVQGLEIRPLDLFPSEMGNERTQAAATTKQRFEDASAEGQERCPRTEVLTKALSRALASANSASPGMLLLSCGNEARKRLMHLLCVFTSASGDPLQNFGLHLWLPGREEDL